MVTYLILSPGQQPFYCKYFRSMQFLQSSIETSCGHVLTIRNMLHATNSKGGILTSPICTLSNFTWLSIQYLFKVAHSALRKLKTMDSQSELSISISRLSAAFFRYQLYIQYMYMCIYTVVFSLQSHNTLAKPQMGLFRK